jgi:DNA-binding HxlR family transcriptional regulator
MRAGSRVLSLFVNPLNATVLRLHAVGPLRLTEVQEKIGGAAETTLRGAVTNLHDVGALDRRRVRRTPYGVTSELTPIGEELLFVAEVLDAWLAQAPNGPIPHGSEAAKAAVKALAGGWSSTLMWVLADRSLTLTELHRLIPDVSYPSLERRLTWMRSTGQVEPVSGQGRGTPYVVTDWLRRSIAPLCAAGRCERRHFADDSGLITDIEVEAAFLLSVPLAPLPASAEGSCMLAVQTETGDGTGDHVSGVTVEVKRGKVTSSKARVEKSPATWALGTAETWLDVVIDGRLENLRLGGARPQLGLDLANGIHHALFGC